MHLYTSFYCEENVWHLLHEQGFRHSNAFAVWIVNGAGRFPMWCRRAAAGRREAMSWDYHVLAVTSDPIWEAWDLDTLCPFPCPLVTYLDQSFDDDSIAAEVAPRFRLVPSERFLASFVSDRSHMRRADGSWIAPPPKWPVIGRGSTTLHSFLDIDDLTIGPLMTLGELRQLASSPRLRGTDRSNTHRGDIG